MRFISSAARENEQTHSKLAVEAQKFRSGRDDWFDGTSHSIDRRIAACTKVLHLAQSAVARSPFDWGPHEIISELSADRRALVSQKEELLNGYQDRVAWKSKEEREHEKSLREHMRQQDDKRVRKGLEKAYGTPKAAAGDRDQDEEGYDTWQYPRDFYDREEAHAIENEIKFSDPNWWRKSGLDADEGRWVSLEAPKFLRANRDVAHFLPELAERARYHAAKATSGFDHARPAARAFVGAVVAAARVLPPPQPVARQGRTLPPAEAMFL